MNKSQNWRGTFSWLFISHRMHLLALTGLFQNEMTDYLTLLIYFTQWNPYPFIYPRPEKGTPFGQSLPIGHYRKYLRGSDSVPRSPAGIGCPRNLLIYLLTSEGTIKRVTLPLLVGSTNFFLHINTLPCPSLGNSVKARDNQSMRKRYFRQSQYAPALFTWAKGSTFFLI